MKKGLWFVHHHYRTLATKNSRCQIERRPLALAHLCNRVLGNRAILHSSTNSGLISHLYRPPGEMPIPNPDDFSKPGIGELFVGPYFGILFAFFAIRDRTFPIFSENFRHEKRQFERLPPVSVENLLERVLYFPACLIKSLHGDFWNLHVAKSSNAFPAIRSCYQDTKARFADSIGANNYDRINSGDWIGDPRYCHVQARLPLFSSISQLYNSANGRIDGADGLYARPVALRGGPQISGASRGSYSV